MKTFSLESILKYINILFLFLMYGVYFVHGQNEYINLNTILLSSVLIFQIQFFLSYAARSGKYILSIVSLVLIFFYVLRVITLNYIPFSNVFNRYNYTCSDVNHTILYIVFANLFLFIGVKLVPYRKFQEIPVQSNTKYQTGNVIILLLFAFFLAFSSYLKNSFLVKISGFITALFFNASYILLACLVYLFYFKNVLSKKVLRFFYFIICIFVFFSALLGSRQAVLVIGMYLIFVLYSVFGKVRIKIRYLVLILCCLPLAISLFSWATLIRQEDMRNGSLQNKLELIEKMDLFSNVNSENVKLVLAPVFDRIAFLDYATEMITQKQTYSSVINLPYYFKSIVDNVLSPGFNVFNVPKVANSLIFIYDNRGTPSHKLVEAYYQSDQLTMYGEIYCLFGRWFSLIIYIFIGIIFTRLIHNKASSFPQLLYKCLVLNLFYIWFNSFGIDWLLLDIVSLTVTYYIFIYLMKSKINFIINSRYNKVITDSL